MMFEINLKKNILIYSLGESFSQSLDAVYYLSCECFLSKKKQTKFSMITKLNILLSWNWKLESCFYKLFEKLYFQCAMQYCYANIMIKEQID